MVTLCRIVSLAATPMSENLARIFAKGRYRPQNPPDRLVFRHFLEFIATGTTIAGKVSLERLVHGQHLKSGPQ
jgi:hypothetical protein